MLDFLNAEEQNAAAEDEPQDDGSAEYLRFCTE
jgi:hypothetical protein